MLLVWLEALRDLSVLVLFLFTFLLLATSQPVAAFIAHHLL